MKIRRRPPPKDAVSVLDAMRDPQLFGPLFEPEENWAVWRALLAAVFGLPLSPAERVLFESHTGRSTPPEQQVREAWLVVGRRGGKSRVAALVAVFLACFRDYRHLLAPGERATVMLLAADKRQARVCMRYVQGLLQGIPLLRGKVLKESAEEIHLDNRVSLEIHAASFRGTRGYTLAAVVCDEIAFWRSDESANPDLEIVNALRPGLATIPQALLIGISSPYARRGVLWEAYRRHWGKPSPDVLIWQAATRDMNPTVSARVVERAHAEDPDAARAEYFAEFRRDIESFLSREAIAAAVVQGRESLAPRLDRDYYAFCDPSGGSGDAMALAIAHRDPERRDRAVLDLVLERRPPFSPDAVVREFSHTLERYGLAEVTGDRYAAEWVRERFRVADVAYRPSELAKSDLYRELLPAMNSSRIELLDLPRLSAQLAALERRTARAGRDTVDHPPRGHDDMANAAAGALWLALRKRGEAEGWRF